MSLALRDGASLAAGRTMLTLRETLGLSGLDGAGVIVPPSPVYEPETTVLLDRMTVKPTAAKQDRINTLIKGMKDLNVWSTLYAFYGLDMPDQQGARLNWVAADSLTPIGGPIFTPDYGYSGDGVGAYLACSIGLTVSMTPSILMGSWHKTAAVASAWDWGTNQICANVRTTSTAARTRCSSTIDNTLTAVTGDGTGSIMVCRGGTAPANNYSAILNGTDIRVVAQNAAAFVEGRPPYLLCVNASSGAAIFSTRALGAFFFGSAITDSQCTALDTLLRAYFAE